MSKDKNPDAMAKFFDGLSLDDSPRRMMPCGRFQLSNVGPTAHPDRRDPNRCGGARCKICYPPKGGAA
jgi:hypothetical protein